MLEFTLIGIPMIFLVIGTIEMARGMWIYHTLAHAVKEGARYAVVHGQGCAIPPNDCRVNISQISRVIRSAGTGLPANTVTLTFTPATNANGSATVTVLLRDNGGTQRSFTSFYAKPYDMESDAWYTDLNVSYELDEVDFTRWMGGDDLKKQVFFTVQNLFDAKPPIVSDCCNPGLQYPTDRVKYDVIGAYFTVGLRVTY